MRSPGGEDRLKQGHIQAIGQLAGKALAQNVAVVRGVHEAVSARVFWALGPSALPVRMAHNGIAGGVYRLLEGTHRVMPQAVASGVALLDTGGATERSASPGASVVLGIVNGILGDSLVTDRNDLALPMAIKDRGYEIDLTRAALTTAFPDAGTRLVVFVHGLCESDRSWFFRQGSEPDAQETSYGTGLQRDLGYLPLYVQYNTGLHVSENGRALADMLSKIVEEWPCPVEEIALVGHSMGGLVVRSACHQAAQKEETWPSLVRHVCCLGTPHLGSHLEQGANVVAWALGRLPETRPFAGLLNSRSVGIKDMRFGSCLEGDWRDRDPDELLKNSCEDVPFLPGTNYYFVAATVTRDRHHPFGQVVGDLLVRSASASGSGRRRVLPFEDDNGRHLGGLHHFHLLNHPAVYEQIRFWLADGAPQWLPMGN
jgi:pimeloyl-ACP methyl ester carboxylesterase